MLSTAKLTAYSIALAMVFLAGCGGGAEVEQDAVEDSPAEEAAPASDGAFTAVEPEDDGMAEDAYSEDTGADTPLAADETYDSVRNGAKLILSYSAENGSFGGSVQNVTEAAMQHVQVQVRLSDGTEIGPTDAMDLEPGQKSEVHLPTAVSDFETWTAHTSVGAGENE